MLIEIFSNRTKYFGIVSPESMYATGHVRHTTGRMPLTRVHPAVFPLQPPVPPPDPPVRWCPGRCDHECTNYRLRSLSFCRLSFNCIAFKSRFASGFFRSASVSSRPLVRCSTSANFLSSAFPSFCGFFFSANFSLFSSASAVGIYGSPP